MLTYLKLLNVQMKAVLGVFSFWGCFVVDYEHISDTKGNFVNTSRIFHINFCIFLVLLWSYYMMDGVLNQSGSGPLHSSE